MGEHAIILYHTIILQLSSYCRESSTRRGGRLRIDTPTFVILYCKNALFAYKCIVERWSSGDQNVFRQHT